MAQVGVAAPARDLRAAHHQALVILRRDVVRNKNLGSSPDGEPGKDGHVPSPPLYSGEILMDPSPRNFNLKLFGRDGRCMEIEALARKLPGLGERIQVTVLRILGRSADSFEQRLFTEFDTQFQFEARE